MLLRDVIRRRIRTEGPLPFAEYMDLALYHPELGYYARADRRSGRTGDFFTSVDIGTLFGELLSRQFAEMWQLTQTGNDSTPDDQAFVIVEAGAGNGRLAKDILDYALSSLPAFYEAVRLTLVEQSQAGRSAHTTTLGDHASKVGSAVELPPRVQGVVFANELLDALPVHPVVMTDMGLREVYVDIEDGDFVERLGSPTPSVRSHIERFGIRLQPGWRAEVSPASVAWVEDAAERLDRGFIMLIDYGHESDELYSLTHATGTLTCYRQHQVQTGGDSHRGTPWLNEPGTTDITAHVDLTAVITTAEQAGLQTLGVLDQTYFLLSLVSENDNSVGGGTDIEAVKRRLALKTLLVPGGLGSTLKVLIFGKNVGTPRLRGCSFARRVT